MRSPTAPTIATPRLTRAGSSGRAGPVAHAGRSSDAFGIAFDKLTAPFDAVRAAMFRSVARPLAPLMADPALRVAYLGSATVIVLFALVCAAPAWMLLLGPLALGVPHLVADLRYLVVRPGLHLRPRVIALVLAPCALAIAFPTLEMIGVALMGAAFAATSTRQRRATVGVVGVVIIAAGRHFDGRAEIVFAHIHNAMALGWLALGFASSRRDRSSLLFPIALTAALTAALALGIAGPSATELGSQLESSGTPAWIMLASMSPTTNADAAARWVLVFAFGQAVHYATWIRLIPELARERRGPRPLRRSIEALRSDLGLPLLLLVLVAALAVPLAALRDPLSVRDWYLRLALFHGPMEIAVAALFVAERRPCGGQRPARQHRGVATSP